MDRVFGMSWGFCLLTIYYIYDIYHMLEVSRPHVQEDEEETMLRELKEREARKMKDDQQRVERKA